MLFLLAVCLGNNPVYALDGYQHKFDIFQATLKKEYLENKILKYLKNDPEIGNHYLLTDNAFYMFATKEDKLNAKPEFVLNFGSKTKPQKRIFVANKLADKPLAGLRVAIDPGHLGGNMAIIEDRFIDMTLPDKTHLQFNEGTLAAFTAKILRNYLVHAGAEVLLTREEPGQSVCSTSFNDCCAKEFGINNEQDWLNETKQQKIINHLKKSKPSFVLCRNENPEERLRSITDAKDAYEKVFALKKALFRLCYNSIDLRARIDKINAFAPDITIIIHFNASGSAYDISSNNYNLVFIPGSFLNGELKEQRFREEFVRLLLTDDLEKSLSLSQEIIKNFNDTLGVPTMKCRLYQPKTTIFVDAGIYCRNLGLTRGVHSPICYGETLIQNNVEEAKRLTQKDFDFEGQLISSRLADVARAYFYGICEYLGLSINS
jgi:N-acetylmuramoyl-L-alanine amidase